MNLLLSSHALLTEPYEPYIYPPCANMNTTADLGLGCPFGGNFYTCQGSALPFIGYCTLNPCAFNSVCPDTYLRPASFNASLYNKISQQACAESIARWYLCSELPITFLGCCLSDPCKQGGCPIRDLRPTRLSDKTEDAATFITSIVQTMYVSPITFSPKAIVSLTFASSTSISIPKTISTVEIA